MVAMVKNRQKLNFYDPGDKHGKIPCSILRAVDADVIITGEEERALFYLDYTILRKTLPLPGHRKHLDVLGLGRDC